MKVYIIVQDFREEYEEPGIVAVYSDKDKAIRALEDWNLDNEDNCEEIRYLLECEADKDEN